LVAAGGTAFESCIGARARLGLRAGDSEMRRAAQEGQGGGQADQELPVAVVIELYQEMQQFLVAEIPRRR
jgi:hypothetical protein